MVKLYYVKKYFFEIRFFFVSKISIFDVHSPRYLTASGEIQKSLFWKPKRSKFGEIFFYAIEFYHTVILQKESRETVYTALRKVSRGPEIL